MNMKTFRLVVAICAISCFICSAKCDPMRALRDFCLNFVFVKSFANFVDKNDDEEDVEEEFFDPATSLANRMLIRSDLSDFSYYGERDEDYLPHGSGELIDDAGGGSKGNITRVSNRDIQ